MVDRIAEIIDLQRKAREASSMASKSPFPKDRKRFFDMAEDYQRRVEQLRH